MGHVFSSPHHPSERLTRDDIRRIPQLRWDPRLDRLRPLTSTEYRRHRRFALFLCIFGRLRLAELRDRRRRGMSTRDIIPRYPDTTRLWRRRALRRLGPGHFLCDLATWMRDVPTNGVLRDRPDPSCLYSPIAEGALLWYVRSNVHGPCGRLRQRRSQLRGHAPFDTLENARQNV